MQVLRKRCERLESMLFAVSSKIDGMQSEKPTGYVERTTLELQQFKMIRFNPMLGFEQSFTQDIAVPEGVKALIVRFALTDINVRRLFWTLTLQQVGVSKSAAVDLTSFFWVGPHPLPSFGTATEIILPWDGKLAKQLKLDMTLPMTPGLPQQHSPWQPMPMMPNPYQEFLNAISYATIHITGLLY